MEIACPSMFHSNEYLYHTVYVQTILKLNVLSLNDPYKTFVM